MRRFVAGWLAFLIIASLLLGVLVHAGGSAADPPAWASPTAITVKRVAYVDEAQHESNLFQNINCGLTDYRLTGSATMQTGCFSETSFGMMDSDSGIVLFNGTDEGVPLLPYVNGQVLVPWPAAGDLLALSSAATGGAYVGLYKGVMANLQEQRNLLGELKAKQLVRPPDIQLNDPARLPLVVNPETLAFSAGGSWLVAEDLNGSFVRINLATLDELPFAPAYGSSGSPGLLKSAVAISPDGRYAAINNEAAGAFKVYDLASCSGNFNGLTPLNCQSHDYRAQVAGRVGGLQAIRHERFINSGLLSFEASSSNPANGGIYELAPTAGISSLINYLGLGDSYTSGEGAFDYVSGSDSADNHCHLSARSYPLLLSQDIFGSEGAHSVACSGAEINDVGSTSDNYRGQVAGVPDWQELQNSQPALLNSIMANFLPGYVAQQRFVKQYQPGVMTVSVGGDDIGFGNLVVQCVEQHLSLHLSDNTCFNTYEDRLELKQLIDRTGPRWVSLYKQLQAEAPGSRLYAIGYPQIASDQGNCAVNVHLNKSELELTLEIIDYLNGAIKQAAGKAKITYVDISQALVGHRLCETASYNVAVNGLTAGKDSGIFGLNFLAHESYHPNALGQQLIEEAILRQTNHFAAASAAESKPPDGTPLLNKPKSGRPVQVHTVARLTSNIVKAGQGTVVHASGSQSGLKPNTAYVIRLDGPGGPVIGTASSNAAGDVDSTATVPAVSSGGHTIDLTGLNQADEPMDISQPVYIPISDSDADGDGINDSADSCPYAINSGTDSDQDGIDDACDGQIGNPPDSGNSVKGTASIQPNSNSNNAGSLASTATPASLTNLAVKTSQRSQDLPEATNRLIAPKRLQIINWRPWLLISSLIWLLILVVLLTWRLVNKMMYQKRRVFTTIGT